MDTQSDESSDNQAKRVANYRVRFRHGVFPSAEAQATRSDIKKYDYFFGSGQTWVDVQGNVDFVDESAQVAAEAKPAEQVKFIHSRRPSKRLIRTRTAEKLEQGSSVESRRAPLRSIRPADNTSAPSAYEPLSTTSSGSWNQGLPYHRHASPATSSVSTSSFEGQSSLDWPFDTSHSPPAVPAAQTPRVPWTLSDPLEAHLFRFWVDTVGPGWDLASPQKVFREVVPQMALKNRMLLDAILMISSQHFQRFDPACTGKPFLYYDRVLQQLIPCLAGIGHVTDEATLVTAIFLRGFEELHAGTHGQQYLSTFELFQGKSGWLFNMNSPVVQACFMIHVRFEIFEALLNEQSLQVDYRNAPPPMVTAPTDDVCWTNRIVWLSGRILQWLTHERHSFEEWQRLKNEVTEWEHNRPQSFDAFFYRESSSASEKEFPEPWFSNACHVDAHQHLGICRVALAMSYDELRRRENSLYDIERTGDAEVAQWLKEVIGVAKCNPSPASASKLAAHVMHKFAGGLQDRFVQRSIMEFLKEVDSSGWRTVATQHWLASEWGWHLHNHL